MPPPPPYLHCAAVSSSATPPRAVECRTAAGRSGSRDFAPFVTSPGPVHPISTPATPPLWAPIDEDTAPGFTATIPGSPVQPTMTSPALAAARNIETRLRPSARAAGSRRRDLVEPPTGRNCYDPASESVFMTVNGVSPGHSGPSAPPVFVETVRQRTRNPAAPIGS